MSILGAIWDPAGRQKGFHNLVVGARLAKTSKKMTPKNESGNCMIFGQNLMPEWEAWRRKVVDIPYFYWFSRNNAVLKKYERLGPI